jgi:hypothetical protein
MWLLVLALAGCSALPSALPKPTGTVNPPVFGVPGEEIEYRVRLRGVVVGSVRVAVGDPGWVDGKRAIIVRSRGESDGFAALIGKLAWECSTTLDLDGGYPIVNREETWIDIAGERDHDVDTTRWAPSDHDHDVHSAVGRVRGWHSRAGERIAFEVHIAGKGLDVEAWHVGREYLAAAKAPAVRYEGTIANRFRFTTWVSDDPSRVPLRLETGSKWGDIAVDLVTYQAP